ncbi:sucrose-binding protein-like [Gastrolobium bilobum]|uniref:sucrose-binding protein-like n=1 Tax=Gastrolobium bilobum TaxID=150636 RepID=UPI002AB2909E|nr:sucrose-binding protein-like [Gastrolobium bilobum]
MAMKGKLCLAIFLFFLLALCSNLAMATEKKVVEDPELKTCKHQCKQQREYSEDDKRICMQMCDKYREMKQKREKQIEEEIRRKKEHEMEEKGNHHHHHSEEEEEEEEEEEKEEKENPYVFEDNDFDTRVDTEDGRECVLQKFTKKSKFLQGIQNFRLAILEANPRSFVSPRHFDSEAVFVDVKGRATIGLVIEDKTERFNLEPGDIMRIPAGTPVYVVNRDANEKLFIAQFHLPVSTPGNFEAFFGPGGKDPESVLKAFSWDVLEAALQTPRGRLEGLFSKQKKGSIFKISNEHVQALAPQTGFWPFGSSRDPFNIFSKSPTFSNQYGRLFEVGPDDKKSGLQGLNFMLTFANITKGSMSTLHYNSHATKIALVIEGDGEGRFEMACPHVSSSKSHSSYHKISARLRTGVVFVVPAGHPFVTIASKKSNLLILCFEVNARGNKKLNFAGKRNIVSALDKNAKELAFNYPAEKVDEIFNRDEQFFFPGPYTFEESEDSGRAYA